MCIGFDLVRPIEGKLNSFGITPRGYNEVIFQLALIAVEDQLIPG